MIRTAEDAIYALSERTYDNRKQLRQQNLQRRNQVTDLYGVVFHAQGDADNPAEFYISISPDLAYYERFQFKLNIQPYLANVKGGTTNTAVTVNTTSLSVSGSSVSPNPHGHTSPSHGHTVVSGITSTSMSAQNFSVKIDNENITPYLMDQHGGDWIDGTGLFPSKDLEDEIDNFYDVLDVASMLMAEGNETKKTNLLKPGFKKVEVIGDGFFSVDLFLYVKYSFTNQ